MVGEIIYKISELTHISPGLLVFITISGFFSIFFYCSYKLLKMQKQILPYIFLIFSPFIFTMQIFNPDAYRKEIICIALLALTIFLSHTKNKTKFNIFFYFLMIIIFPAIIMTHEALVIFLPYFLIVFLSKNDVSSQNFIKTILLSIPTAITFISMVTIAREITIEQTLAIYKSLDTLNYHLNTPVDGGAINFLACKAFITINAKYIIYYLIAIILAMLAFIPIRGRLKYFFKNYIFLMLILSSFIATGMLCSITTDWGRYIYYNLVSIFLISLLNINNNKISLNKSSNLNRLSSINLITLIFVYLTFWNMSTLKPAERMFTAQAIYNAVERVNKYSNLRHQPDDKNVGHSICKQQWLKAYGVNI